MTQLIVGYPEGWDIEAWSRLHRSGERPDAWPYGLDQLATVDRALAVVSLPVSRWGLRADGLSNGSSPRIGVGWDETTVARMSTSRSLDAIYGGVIWSSDPPEGIRDRLQKTLVRRGLLRTNGLWCLSRPQVEAVEQSLGRRRPHVEFLRFGIDAGFFAYRDYPERPLVLSVGGDRDRDPDTLFEALKRVHRAIPQAELVVQTPARVSAPAGVRTVKHLGHVELRELYARAAVVAIATRPNLHVSGMTVSLEAMATGRPVVITGSPGMEDYVDDCVGRVVKMRDSMAMADAIVELLRAPDLAKRVGTLGREKVMAQHTSSVMCAAISNIILNGGSGDV